MITQILIFPRYTRWLAGWWMVDEWEVDDVTRCCAIEGNKAYCNKRRTVRVKKLIEYLRQSPPWSRAGV